MSEVLDPESEKKFLQHQLQKTPEYLFAQKLTNRFTRDMQLYIGICAELLMISRFSQQKQDVQILIDTAFYANEIKVYGIDGVGVNFTFTSDTLHSNHVEHKELREFIISVNDNLASCYFNTHFDADKVTNYGPYQLPNNQMDNNLLLAIADWLLHRCSHPPTKLNSQFWGE